MVSLRVLNNDFKKYVLVLRPGALNAREIRDLPEADIVKSFVIDTIGLVCVFNQLMNGQSGIVWLKI